eukprot:TRINITY_DN8056_c0_g1_i3.p1 TRINITY_DN8056_c0_g1~~TRINITY_DN8056_c0_g1_i3.p1  ORF type:complete len:138 (-),score=32.86 TRINITY_DN8056_c0_g1_i3:1-357(-)
MCIRDRSTWESKLRNVFGYQKFTQFLSEINLDSAIECLKLSGKSNRSWIVRIMSKFGAVNSAAKIQVLVEGRYKGEVVNPKWIGLDFCPKSRHIKKMIKQDPQLDKNLINLTLPDIKI